jgi:tRNA (guanine-N7-)-methyltransferase
LLSWALNRVIAEREPEGGWGSVAPSGRLFVEIGFGNGEFLEYLGRTYRETAVVGIEVSQACAAKGARRAMAAGLDNVRIMHGDARFLLGRCFEPESVSRLFMNYPCPWPKSRHAARRVTVPAFADLLGRVLKRGGYFELATDVGWYAREAQEVITSHGGFESEPIERNPVRPYVTKYERKWKSMNKETWLLVVRKVRGSRATETEREDWPMELESNKAVSVEEMLARLKGSEGKTAGGRGHWVMRETFLSPDKIGLVLVITSDDGFEQHFYLKIIPGKAGFKVKVDSVGHPYRTPAMRAALSRVLDLVGR